MPYRELKSDKKCKDCGKEAHSWQVGFENPETKEILWHQPHHYNHCKKCRHIKAMMGVEKRRSLKHIKKSEESDGTN